MVRHPEVAAQRPTKAAVADLVMNNAKSAKADFVGMHGPGRARFEARFARTSE
jgi:hypothetical protein